MRDPLEDLFNSEKTADGAPRKGAPEGYEPKHIEKCSKCRGSGKFVGRNGRVFGPCFGCKGNGTLAFKTSPESRAKSRRVNAERKAKTLQENLEEFMEAHPAECAYLRSQIDRSAFCASLWEKLHLYGELTEGQLTAVKNSIERQATWKAETAAREAAASMVDSIGVDRLNLAFDTAIAAARAKGRNFRWPKITIGGITISPAGSDSKNHGALYVKEHGNYLGKIKNGKFLDRNCAPETKTKILAFIADPKQAAIAYGIETGICCVCNATLTREDSMTRGIGPICAQKFGW
jgi:hypothetical protein